MFRRYTPGAIPPVKAGDNKWFVHCEVGACQVLRSGEPEEYLKAHPTGIVLIDFSNGAYADIEPGSSLWVELTRIASKYVVEVFALSANGPYTPWTGLTSDLHLFDAIKIHVNSDE